MASVRPLADLPLSPALRSATLQAQSRSPDDPVARALVGLGRLLVAECLSEECFRRRRFDGGAANAAEILSGPGATPLPLLELPLGDGNLLLLTKAEQPGQLRLIVHHEAFEAVAEIPLRGSEGRLLAFEGEDMAALNLTACIAEAVASIPARRDSTRH